jgi:hypothetical protein
MKVKRFTYGLKSRINLGNYESKEIVIEYTLDDPTPEEVAQLKEDVLAEIIADEQKMRTK